MGPDATSDQYRDRIDGAIKRAGTFESKTNNYMMIHCNDPKDYCKKKVDGKTIGGM